ncbi:MAG: ABC transporter permease [Clostridiales bacterium]|nr:ABC transporter permease [Clostridiales bacterium]
MFAKLALRNVRRQISNYLIYFVTVALSVALLFAVNNLSYSDRIRQLAELSSDMKSMFNMVTVLSGLVTALVLSYATGFMLKLRKKEFGMYLTLGMTRRNIQALFACETWMLSGLALIAGMGAGLVIFQLLVALFSSIMELPFSISAYSVKGIALTLAVSVGLFALSSLASVRYLKKVTISDLLKEEAAERSEKHPVLWCILSVVTLAGLIGCLIITYQNLMAAFHNEDGVILLLWLATDLVMIFLAHFTLSRTLAGMLLRSKRLKNRGTNTVVLRGLSGKMTVNSLLIGALATLLVFAVGMSNVAFCEKIFSDLSIKQDCPYDVMAMFDLSEEHGVSMEEGIQIVEQYSPIISQIDYQLYSKGETTLCSSIIGYDLMEWTDKYMPLSQFNALLTGCGYEPLTLKDEYLLFTTVQGISDVDFSDKSVTLNGKTYSWAGNSTFYPDFARREYMYFIIPDEAVAGMPVSDVCAAYTLADHRPDAMAMLKDLTYVQKTSDGEDERCDFAIQEAWRLFRNANAGTLIIGTLYVSTVFVCMALAILSLKTLSTLDDERRRFAVLYRLGADGKTQKAALFKQTGAFFLMPFALPLILTVPLGMIFGKVYEIWNFAGLSGQKAMETAALISLVLAGIYALYFFITYRIACEQVVCLGTETRGAGTRVQ